MFSHHFLLGGQLPQAFQIGFNFQMLEIIGPEFDRLPQFRDCLMGRRPPRQVTGQIVAGQTIVGNETILTAE